jgi:hypothetical protein
LNPLSFAEDVPSVLLGIIPQVFGETTTLTQFPFPLSSDLIEACMCAIDQVSENKLVYRYCCPRPEAPTRNKKKKAIGVREQLC